jgi:hypothetical protein
VWWGDRSGHGAVTREEHGRYTVGCSTAESDVDQESDHRPDLLMTERRRSNLEPEQW